MLADNSILFTIKQCHSQLELPSIPAKWMADEPARRQVGPPSQPTYHAKMRVHAARAAEAAPWQKPVHRDAIEAAGATSDASGFLQVKWLINGVKLRYT